jgi:hypothetical protein
MFDDQYLSPMRATDSARLFLVYLSAKLVREILSAWQDIAKGGQSASASMTHRRG